MMSGRARHRDAGDEKGDAAASDFTDGAAVTGLNAGGRQMHAAGHATRSGPLRRHYVRLSSQRILHEPKDYTAKQRAADPDGTAYSYYRTALHDPVAGPRLLPWGLVGARSDPDALPDLDREIAQSRVTWLTGDDYGWGHHVTLVAKAGLPPEKVAKIPEGVSAGGWTEREAALIAGADELHTGYFIADETWVALRQCLRTSQLLHYVFVVGMYHSQAMYAKSIGFPSESGMPEIPDTPGAVRSLGGGAPIRLPTQRILPVDPVSYTAEQRELDPTGSADPYFRTTLHDPWIARQWRTWLEFMTNRTDRGAMPAYRRELAVLRMSWICQDDHGWGRHAPLAERAGRSPSDIARIPGGLGAGGWDEQDTILLTAVDELYDDFFISDETWTRLATFTDTRQVLDLVLLAGAQCVSAMYANTIGVPRDPGAPALPSA